MNTTTVYCVKFKGDSSFHWFTYEGYHEMILCLSTGDYHTHRARRVELSTSSLNRLTWHSGKGLTHWISPKEADLRALEHDEGGYWERWDGKGDCYFESVIY